MPASTLEAAAMISRSGLLGYGLHIILRHKAVEVCSCTVVSRAKVRDIHFTVMALSYGDPAFMQWSRWFPKDRSPDTCRIPQGLRLQDLQPVFY